MQLRKRCGVENSIFMLLPIQCRCNCKDYVADIRSDRNIHLTLTVLSLGLCARNVIHLHITNWMDSSQESTLLVKLVTGCQEGGLPYLGGSAVMTPVSEIVKPSGSLFYASTRSDWPFVSAENNQFDSITFSSRDTWTQICSNISPKCII